MSGDPGTAVKDFYAKRDTQEPFWLVLTMDKLNVLKVHSQGSQSSEDLDDEWDQSRELFVLLRVIEPISQLPKTVFISWCGEGVPVSKKGLHHQHVHDMSTLLKGYHVHIQARSEDDVSMESIMNKVKQASGAKYGIHGEKGPSAMDSANAAEPVGTQYTPIQTTPKPFGSSSATGEQQSPGTAAPSPAKPVFSRSNSSAVSTPAQQSGFPSVITGPPSSSIYTVNQRPSATSPATQTTTPVSARPVFSKSSFSSSSFGGNSALPAQDSSSSFSTEKKELTFREKRLEQERLEREREQQELNKAELQEKETNQKYSWKGKQNAEEEERKRQDQENASLVKREQEARERAAEKEQQIMERKRLEEKERLEREKEERLDREKREREERLEKERAEREALERQQQQASQMQSPPGSSVQGLQALALYDYTKDEDNEINLTEGELISNVVEEEGGWYCGTNTKGETGYFPGNYVELRGAAAAVGQQPQHEEAVAVAPAHPETQVQESGLAAIAQYDYDAAEDNEISFKTGDLITGITQPDPDWWHGNVNGVWGLFPANYVQMQ